ncbi:MAG: HEAT repeat domain-containing protein [Planctomycetes bacterium]|nr:HEAT repeat domain-containing protein [Planctomycetota bacterium]
MMALSIALATLLPLLFLAFFLLGRCWQRWRSAQDAITDVTRQHFEIFQSGEFNEAAVETAKRRFHLLFERGGERAVEASIQAGPQFIYQVRALAEIGTDAAGRILERQLQRRLSDNHLEQTWYTIDLAACLRLLNRQESLPSLLRCSEPARESPLGHYFAAETVCILGFAGYLHDPETPDGQSALRLVHRVMEGLRFGLPPHVITEARLGELIEKAWDHRPTGAMAVHVRIVHETLRVLRRAPHLKAALSDDLAAQETLDWQLLRLGALESTWREFLRQAPAALLARVGVASGAERAEICRALRDLRVEAAGELWPLVLRGDGAERALMIDVLRWSRDPRVGPWLREFAREHVPMEKRANNRPAGEAPRQPSFSGAVPYANILTSLRGHPSPETERFLLLACQDWDPTIRMAALSSLGWVEPMEFAEVRDCLARCKRDPSPEVRQTARAALARLGERGSLHWFRQALLADDPHQVAEAAHVIANEGLTLLWPELDRLIDCGNPDVALHAREASERLAEEMEQAHIGLG